MKPFFTLLFSISLSMLIAQSPTFPPLDTNYRALEIRVANTLKMDVVFEGGKDAVWTGTQYGVAKTWHDFTGMTPLGLGNDSCLLIVNHELRTGARNPILGDGGGMTVFRVNRNASTGRWAVAPYSSGILLCEAFFLDLSIQNPTLNDLRPFVAGAADGELTGSVSTPDGKTIFINSQHPSGTRNIPPFNNDVTIAITGFSVTTPTNEVKVSEGFSVYPNPAQDVINFNKTTDVSIYNISGKQIRVERNVNQINVSDLNTGIYFLQNIKGEVVKLVKQ